jgi:putative ABC transport system permease protein
MVQSVIVSAALAVAGGSILDLRRILQVSPGFDVRGLVVAKVQLLGDEYRNPDRSVQFYDRVSVELRGRPGIEGPAITSAFPFAGVDLVTPVPLPAPGTGSIAASQRRIDAAYLPMLRIPVLGGRGFSPEEIRERRPVAVVSRSLALALFGTTEAVGKRFAPNRSLVLEVVGVVSDVRARRLDEAPLPTYYVPLTVATSSVGFIVIRSGDAATTLADLIRSAVRTASPTQPVDYVVDAEHLLAQTVQYRTFAAAAVTGAGILSLILATGGLLGLVSCDVRQRRFEIAVRLASGASQTSIIRGVVIKTLYPVLVGVAIALPVALLITQLSIAAAQLEIAASAGSGWLLTAGIVASTSALAAGVGAVTAGSVEPAAMLTGHHRGH